MDLYGSSLSGAELRRRVGHLSQVGGVRLLTSDNGPSRGVRLIEFRTGTGPLLRDRRRARLRCGPGRLSRRVARLDAADADAGAVVLRGPGEFRLAPRRPRRLQQHLRPDPYRQPGRGVGRALQFPGTADRPLRRPRPRGAAPGRTRLARRALGGRAVHPRGGGSRHPGPDLWREPGDDADLPRRTGRIVVHHGRRGREPRLPAGRAHAPLPYQRRLPVRRRGLRADRSGRRAAAAPVRHGGRQRPRRAGRASSRRNGTGCSRPSSIACGPTPMVWSRSRSSTQNSSAGPG